MKAAEYATFNLQHLAPYPKLVILSAAKDLIFKILRCAQNDRLNDNVLRFVVFIAMTQRPSPSLFRAGAVAFNGVTC
ncbi:MAG: hypothetical protein VR67_18585 [Peptococcaceae bacterium BRH_c8a]|nr:MAG: hypothetical protein VR67_18585 [Peptococcaceae bacterium BRH_c8a]